MNSSNILGIATASAFIISTGFFSPVSFANEGLAASVNSSPNQFFSNSVQSELSRKRSVGQIFSGFRPQAHRLSGRVAPIVTHVDIQAAPIAHSGSPENWELDRSSLDGSRTQSEAIAESRSSRGTRTSKSITINGVIGTGAPEAVIGTGTPGGVTVGTPNAVIGTGSPDAVIGTGTPDAVIGTGSPNAVIGTGVSKSSLGAGFMQVGNFFGTDAVIGTGQPTDAVIGTGESTAAVIGTGID